jgi:hypothetical protein
MRIEIRIEADNLEESKKVLEGLAASLGGTGKQVVVTTETPQPETETKPKRKGTQTRAKAEDPATEETTPEKEPVVTETETTITEATLTVAQMQRKLAELKTNKGLAADQIKTVIKKYGAEKISGIDPSKFNAILKDVEAL